MAINYMELLKDPRWQKLRLKVFEREGFICERCGNSKEELQVHHKYYKKNCKPWDYSVDSLECLCKKCHETIKNINDELSKYLNEMPENYKLTILGFIKGLYLSANTSSLVKINNYEEADGISRFFDINVDSLIKNIVGDVSFDTIYQLIGTNE